MKAISKKSESIIIRDENVERYLKEIRTDVKFTKEEERQLINEAKQGNIQSRNKLVSAHLKFVINCVKEYQVKGIKTGDLINEGNEGLIEAVEKFDLTKDVRFITCAVWWIRHRLLDFVRKNFSLIEIPFNQQAELKKITSLKEKLDSEVGCELTPEEVINSSPDIKYSFKYVRSAFACSREMESLNRRTEEGDELIEILNFESTSPAQILEKNEKYALLYKYLELLPEQQKAILKMYYGFENGVERKDSDIASILNLTPERVRQLRVKGQNLLKNNAILQNC